MKTFSHTICICIAVLAVFLSDASFAQENDGYGVSGYVKDPSGPVAGAFVIGYSGARQTSFTYTGGNGEFSLSSRDGSVIDRVNVSMLGYKPVSVDLKGKRNGIEIMLEVKRTVLRSSVVKADVIEEKSDTLVYHSNAFKDGLETTAGDLLSKLPGVTVSQTGGIYYKGKPINKFYVEGMDLMGNRYGVVTNNLSADDIARVEIYKNHQPMNVLKDIVPTDKAAVNIILKDDVKGSWLFNGDLALGVPEFPQFEARTMFTRFTKKSQSLFLLKGNDLGKDIIQELREQAYFGKTGAFLVSEGDMEPDFISMLNPRRSPLAISKEFWYDNLSGIGSLNHLSKIGNTAQLRVSVNMAAERYDEQSVSGEEIRFPDGGVLSLVDRNSHTDDRYYMTGKMTYEKNAAKSFISDELSFSGELHSSVSSVDGTLAAAQRYDLPSLKIHNSFRIVKKTGERTAIEISDNAAFLRNNHSATYEREDAVYGQTYDRTNFSNDVMAHMGFKAKGHSLGVSAGLTMAYTGLDTFLEHSGRDEGTDLSLNAARIRPYVTISDNFYIGRISTRVSLPASVSVISASGMGTSVHPLVSPNLNLSYDITQSLEAKAGISYSMSVSDEKSLLGGPVMTSYRTMAHTDSLGRRNSLSAGLSLSYSDNPSLFYVTLSATAGRSMSDRTPASEYSESMTETYYIPYDNGSSSYGTTLSVKKYFGVKTLVTEGSISYNDSRMDEYLQGIASRYRTSEWSPSFSFSLNPVDWFVLKGSASLSFMSVSGAAETSGRSLTVEGTMRIKPVKQLAFDVSADYLRESLKDIKISNDPLIRASVSWKLPKATAFIECRNILNVREYRREYSTTFRDVSLVRSLKPFACLVGIKMSI